MNIKTTDMYNKVRSLLAMLMLITGLTPSSEAQPLYDYAKPFIATSQ